MIARSMIAICVVVIGCATAPPWRSMEQTPIPPRIDPPPASSRRVVVGTRVLSKGVRGRLPVRDGDHFFVTVEASSKGVLTPSDVRTEAIVPVLQALNLAGNVSAWRIPGAGISLPQASLAALAQSVALDPAGRVEFAEMFRLGK